MTFIPGIALSKATRSALQIFARHKPAIFKIANEASQASDDFVADYARALIGVTLDAIPEAAQRWVSTKIEIASPASFGLYARGIDAAEFRATAPPEQSLAAQAGKKERWPGARAFWFERHGEPRTAGQWDEHHAIAFSVPNLGCIGISKIEVDRMYAREIQWGWINDIELPEWALDLMGRSRPAAVQTSAPL